MKIALFIDGKVGIDIANIFEMQALAVEFLILNSKANFDYKKKIKKKVPHSIF